MIDKPIKLEIRLSYKQAQALLSQLKYRLDQYRNSPIKDEMNSFKKWKEQQKDERA